MCGGGLSPSVVAVGKRGTVEGVERVAYKRPPAASVRLDRGSCVIPLGRKRQAYDGSDPDAAARWERVARRAAQASTRDGAGPARPLRLELTESLLMAHDPYMLGELADAPLLRWDIATAQAALATWSVQVVPDGALTWNRQLPVN